jgi:hypothetical protein
MAETKYGKYIILGSKPPGPAPGEPPRPKAGQGVIHMDDEVVKGEGGFYWECVLVWQPADQPSPAKSHSHDFDEYLGFVGSNPDDPFDLCGEVELYLGDEKHVLTKTCVVFVPKGLPHCPINIKRVDRPFIFFTSAPIPLYYKGEDK